MVFKPLLPSSHATQPLKPTLALPLLLPVLGLHCPFCFLQTSLSSVLYSRLYHTTRFTQASFFLSSFPLLFSSFRVLILTSSVFLFAFFFCDGHRSCVAITRSVRYLPTCTSSAPFPVLSHIRAVWIGINSENYRMPLPISCIYIKPFIKPPLYL